MRFLGRHDNPEPRPSSPGDGAASPKHARRSSKAVEEAQASRAPIQRFGERFAARVHPGRLASPLAVALLTPSFARLSSPPASYQGPGAAGIACPCALADCHLYQSPW